MKFAAIREQEKAHPIAWMCRILRVSRSGYYAWRRRDPSARALEDRRLAARVKATFEENRGVYGSPRIHRELREAGEEVGVRRVARLMREQGLQACRAKRFRKTTDSKHSEAIADNLVQRHFGPLAPNELWATDITYIRTWSGWAYLAAVLDLYSRRVVGWAVSTHLRTDLALEALQRALRTRQPPRGLIHHSDRGVQYASAEYRAWLKRHGIIASMSRKGDCWDNAVLESFFATLKKELIYRTILPTRRIAKSAIDDYIINFYNRRRKHSTLGYRSPIEHEQAFQEARLCA